MKKLLIALMLLLPTSAYAQKSKATLTSEINTNFASGIGITASALRATTIDIINSYYDLAGGTSLACAAHQWVAGLPTLSSLTCTQPAIADISGWGTGVATALGTNINFQNGIISPTPSRNGDIIFWNNGTNLWAVLPGNNSGTQVLSENSTGVPLWITAPGTGTVTSAVIAAGTGISVTGTCTITSTGTCTIAVNQSVLTNSLVGDVAMNNTANYFPGPTVAQGTSGTWWASGNAAVLDTAGGASIVCKLWDGTTVIDSGNFNTGGVSNIATMSLSGYIVSPAGNIRIDCRDVTTTSGVIKFNNSGNSKDSTISVHRIQ